MRSRTLFLLAIVMGLITTILFVLTFNTESSEEQEQPVEMTTVVTVVSPISENQIITEEMVEVKEVPADGVHAAALSEAGEVVGKIASAKMETGEIILNHRIQSVEDEKSSLTKKVKPGYRGISVGVNIVQSVSNLIEPEDEVDIIYTIREKVGDKEIVNTSILYSKIRVLAIGQRITVPSDDEQVVEYTTVTLEMKPEDTVKLVKATETGTLHLTLHSKIIEE